MFIDQLYRAFALRQEGHVKLARYSIQEHIALLAEGVDARTSFYKHGPPDGGPLSAGL